jgi:hypothetical protein
MGLPDDERERMVEYLSTVNDLLGNKIIHPKDISLIAITALESTRDYLTDARTIYTGIPRAIAREGIAFVNDLIEKIEKAIPQKDDIEQLKYLLKLLQPYDTLLPRLNSRA